MEIKPGDLVYFLHYEGQYWDEGELGMYIGPSTKYDDRHEVLWVQQADDVSNEGMEQLLTYRGYFLAFRKEQEEEQDTD